MTHHADTIRAVRAPRGRAWLLAALLTTVGAVLILAPLASAGGTGRPKSCGSYTGPRWSAGGHSGTHYAVYAVKGASCSLALAWAPRLSKQKPHGAQSTLNGPSGWGCFAQPALPHQGFCAERGGKIFGWAPSV